MPLSRITSFVNGTLADADQVEAEYDNIINGVNANESAINAVSSQSTYAGTRTFLNDVVVNGVLTAGGGFLATQGGKPFGYEFIPKPVQTASNLFEIKINGTIQATLFSPTATVAPFYKQFTGSNLTVALNGVTGFPNSVDATRVSGAMYYFWLIGKDDGTLAGLFSTSNTSPIMPTGYTWRRLLPWACATYPPSASYTNGSTTVTDIVGSGKEGAFIEHRVLNWSENPVISYVCRFPNGVTNTPTNGVTLISYNKNYSSSFAIENLACLNVTVGGQPMWLVPPETESVSLMTNSTALATLNLGIETTSSSGSYLPVDAYNASYFGAGASISINNIPIVSRRIRLSSNNGNNSVAVREFRCNFTNFWL